MSAQDADFSRLDRVAATIRRALAGPLGELGRAAGAGMVTITDVDVQPDMRRAEVFLSIYADDDERQRTLEALSARVHELQRHLAGQLRTKRTPVLRLRLDDSIERGDRIGRLLSGDRDAD
ncbi:MAG: 30S ribosome-binding factor RbfA [Gammaproteobacteria bacterium]